MKTSPFEVGVETKKDSDFAGELFPGSFTAGLLAQTVNRKNNGSKGANRLSIIPPYVNLRKNEPILKMRIGS